MNENPPASDESAQSAESTPQVQIPKPLSTPPEQPATEQQLEKVEREMNAFERSTLRWARVAVIMSGLAAIFVCAQWWEMRSSSKDTHDLAVAAGKQAEVAARQLEASARPWMAAELAMTGPITFDPRGAQINFTVFSANVGHSPALNVDVRAKVLNGQSQNFAGEQKKLCPPDKGNPAVRVPWGETVFPGKDSIQRFGLILDKSEMNRSRTFVGFKNTVLLPYVVACVDYVVGSSGEHHQTYLGMFIMAKEPTTGRPMEILAGQDLPLDRLIFYREQRQLLPSN